MDRGGGDAEDTTELSALRAELAAVLDRFQIMSRTMNEGMWDWNITDNAVWYSDAMFTVFGMNPTRAPSFERWTECIHPDDRDRVLAGFRAVLDNGQAAWSDEYRFIRPHDGAMLEVHDRGIVMHGANGAPRRMVGVVMDMTSQRRLERELRHAQKMQAIGLLAGGIAHDFNNILQAATLELALLLSTRDVPAKASHHALEVRLALDRAASLTRQLLVFSRREAMRRQRLDLHARIADLGTLLQRVLGELVSLELVLAPDAMIADVDPSMLDQVLINLAVNARDAMPKGGTLTIATTRDRPRTERDAPGEHWACILVTDTGCGMSPELQTRIFDPFFTTKETSGTGLGLATVHGIVEQHGGHIEVDSQVGRGSCFRIFLPAVEASDGDSEPPRAAGGPGHGDVLVVEDDAPVRRALCELLGAHGYMVTAADSGVEALRAWDAAPRRFDLVLTDLVMPGMNGRELADQLRARSPDARILVMTGYGRDLDREAVARTYPLIDKPINADRLLLAIHELLAANERGR